ncbi:phosphomannomutase/phosphoglucomutase [Novosphingobium soli]|uniref:Phosphomannomutase/phosphoglucomutase n=1 Tax=Novosphingobium soli TaxID=574956 RepID=A0ABV6CRW1_9SPHN
MSHGHAFHPSILREYDIRGVHGETLFEADAQAIGRCFAAEVRRAGGGKVVVGRDGRLSSPALEAALVGGLLAGGIDVVRIGLGPTPMLYFAEASIPEVQGGIQVTGSHNPPDHNGFKMVLAGRPFFGPDIQRLGAAAAKGEEGAGPGGARGREETRDVLPAYVARLVEGQPGGAGDAAGGEGAQGDAAERDAPERDETQRDETQRDESGCAGQGAARHWRIGWDAGNGAAGPALERLASLLPGEHYLLHSEVDGRFPHHHPDPTIPENLADLQALVAAKNLDFGVAFDGDADRIGVVDAQGQIVDADRLLAIFARDVLARHPGATVIADVKASRLVFETVRALGGQALMAPSGHSHIKSRMKATGALLGGETSGHMFFADDWYGFDDGLYAAVRLIAACHRLRRSLTALHQAMPATHTSPELRFAVPEARKFAVVQEVRARLAAEGAAVNALDGVRVDTAQGWWLLRASNTQAALTARAEGDTPAALAHLLAEIDRHLAASGIVRAPG